MYDVILPEIHESDFVFGIRTEPGTRLFLTLPSSFFLVSWGRLSPTNRLYSNCEWDERAIRKLVGDGKLASRSKGGDCANDELNQECPICFLYYSEVNTTKCCNASICTECFLQVRPQKEKLSCCPFCNSPELGVSVAKQLTVEEIREKEVEEQRVMEAVIKSREIAAESNKENGGTSNENSDFGSTLAKDSRVAEMRARSESITSSGSDHNQTDDNIIRSLSMTPEERRRLEDEMKAQLVHPVALREQAMAEEQRLDHDRAYSRSHGGGSVRMQRALERLRSNSRYQNRRGRDWNQIVDAFERGGNGQVRTLDDLVVLEAAIMLGMEQDRRAREDSNGFDASIRTREGFPLARPLFNRREEETSPQNVRSRSFGERSRERQSMGDTAMDTAALLMRGISEEDQVAMAIAASLQDQNTNDNEENHNAEEDTENDSDSEFVDEDGESDELNDNELLQDANDLDIVEEEMEEEVDQEASQSYENSESLDERRSKIMDEENKSTLDLVTKQKFMELDKPNEARNITAVAVEQL